MVAPLKEPSKILTGTSTKRGPISESDILGPSIFFPLPLGAVEEVVASVDDVGGGVSRIWMDASESAVDVATRAQQQERTW